MSSYEDVLRSVHSSLAAYEKLSQTLSINLIQPINTMSRTLEKSMQPYFELIGRLNSYEFDLWAIKYSQSIKPIVKNITLLSDSIAKTVDQTNLQAILNTVVNIAETDLKDLPIRIVQNCIPELKTDVVDREINEVENDIKELFYGDQNKNWQQRVWEIFLNWKDKNPLIAALLIIILTMLIEKSLTTMIETSNKLVSVPKAAVRESPNTQSVVNNFIYQDQRVYIVEDIQYYYRIQTVAEDTGDILSDGWVSKRSLRPYKKMTEDIE